jgi:hypothetical protein
MLIRALGLLPVVNDTAAVMAPTGLVTLFNDMCVLAPASLADDRIRWEVVDDLTVKGSLRDDDLEVSATLYFNPSGELINFVTEDRYMERRGEHIRLPWSTPLTEYRQFGLLRLASRGSALWHVEEGDFAYAEFVLKEVQHNPASFTMGEQTAAQDL